MRITKKLRVKVREDMMKIGWTIIDTSELIEKWKLKFSVAEYKNDSDPLQRHNLMRRYRKFAKKIAKILTASKLVDGDLRLEYGNARYEGKNDKRHYSAAVRDWHSDGGYIRTICCVEGPTTEVRQGRKIIKLPMNHTLIITAKGREELTQIPATIHRGPNTKERRKLFVFAYTPPDLYAKRAAELKRLAKLSKKLQREKNAKI
jgi:hypothetical protein